MEHKLFREHNRVLGSSRTVELGLVLIGEVVEGTGSREDAVAVTHRPHL